MPTIGTRWLTEAEWLAATGPQPGEHELYDAACDGARISQEYRIRPSVVCEQRGANAGPNPTRDCRVDEDYCASAADCTERSGGVCVGHTSTRCEYADQDFATPCESDADCTALPGGICGGRIEPGGELCYPTGECRVTPLASCAYPVLNEACASDADCTAAPGGSCRHDVHFTECAYNECGDTGGCRPAARCVCAGVRQCISADCFGDGDCTTGYRCEPSLALECGNLNPPAGYHCHAPSDECQSDADCAGSSCVFDPELSHWACRDVRCFTR